MEANLALILANFNDEGVFREFVEDQIAYQRALLPSDVPVELLDDIILRVTFGGRAIDFRASVAHPALPRPDGSTALALAVVVDPEDLAQLRGFRASDKLAAGAMTATVAPSAHDDTLALQPTAILEVDAALLEALRGGEELRGAAPDMAYDSTPAPTDTGAETPATDGIGEKENWDDELLDLDSWGGGFEDAEKVAPATETAAPAESPSPNAMPTLELEMGIDIAGGLGEFFGDVSGGAGLPETQPISALQPPSGAPPPAGTHHFSSCSSCSSISCIRADSHPGNF